MLPAAPLCYPLILSTLHVYYAHETISIVFYGLTFDGYMTSRPCKPCAFILKNKIKQIYFYGFQIQTSQIHT